MTSCEHLPIWCVEDEKEGTIICTHCAFVIGELYVHAYNPTIFESFESKAPVDSPIADICANFNISSAIQRHCESLLEKFQILSQTRKIAKTSLYAYCIYRGLTEHNIPISPQEILCMTGLELSTILNIEKLLTTSTICEFPTSDTFIERFANQCGLSFKDVQCITYNCKYANEICENFAAQTIAAALIVIYCKLHKKRLNAKFISSKCLVSSSSVYRVVKKLNIKQCNRCQINK